MRRALAPYRRNSPPDSPITRVQNFIPSLTINFPIECLLSKSRAFFACHILNICFYIPRLNFSGIETTSCLYHLQHWHNFWHKECPKHMFTELIPHASGSLVILFPILCLNHSCFQNCNSSCFSVSLAPILYHTA